MSNLRLRWLALGASLLLNASCSGTDSPTDQPEPQGAGASGGAVDRGNSGSAGTKQEPKPAAGGSGGSAGDSSSRGGNPAGGSDSNSGAQAGAAQAGDGGTTQGIGGSAGNAGTTAGAGGARVIVDDEPDYGKLIVESTNRQYPKPSDLGGWAYAKALFLHGEYLVYKRVKNPAYLAYVKAWVDAQVDESGNIKNSLFSLDHLMPGNLLLDLYEETKQEKYKLAAQKIRKRFDTFPRTSDGGFWHNPNLEGQLWSDGTFMAVPFLMRYGRIFNDSTYANDEGIKQLTVYAKHLHNPGTGLFLHAWDEQGDTGWSNSQTHQSEESWCRAMGWYGVASIIALELLPQDHSKRPQVIAILKGLVEAWTKYQDTKTGRWYQVIDKGTNAKNWLETSCSSMLTYSIAKAAEQGFVEPKYTSVAQKAYAGVLQKLSVASDGTTSLSDVSEGTNVGNLNYYLNRKRVTNDFHGLGAFLIMYEGLRQH